MKTLYAKDNAGNILVWKATILNNGIDCSISFSYGRIFGAKQLDWERNIVPKNVGRANETTAYEQAESRLRSRVNKKKKAGYRELTSEEKNYLNLLPSEDTIKYINYLESIISDERLDEEGFKKPMKAAQYFRSKKPFTDPTGKVWKDQKYYFILNPHVPKDNKAYAAKFPMMLQPKINGVRAFLYLENGKAKLKSKDGLQYTAPSHIIDWATNNKGIFGEKLNDIIDGELYIYNEPLNEVQSAVKAVNLNTSRVVFVAFDLAIEKLTNLERWKLLKIRHNVKYDLNCPIDLIKTVMVKKDSQVQQLTDDYIKSNYEGSILRDPNALYGFGSRRNTMLKLKRDISEDFYIKGVVPQAKRNDLGMFLCEYKGVEFTINPTLSEKDKAHIRNFPNEYIGKKLQTRFYEWTPFGKPLHIIDTIIRDYE